MTKGEYQQNLMNYSACTQVGALLQDIVATMDAIYSNHVVGQHDCIPQETAEVMQGVKHIADILSDKVADTSFINDAWDAAERELDKVLDAITE